MMCAEGVAGHVERRGAEDIPFTRKKGLLRVWVVRHSSLVPWRRAQTPTHTTAATRENTLVKKHKPRAARDFYPKLHPLNALGRADSETRSYR